MKTPAKYAEDSLGTRMKEYEHVTRTFLPRRTPVIIRLDGKAFHTFTKCLKDIDPTLANIPFSEMMHNCMLETTRRLVATVQNCVFGYTQSDEISLLLRDYDQFETDAWYANNIQKMCSVSASVATAAFNFQFSSFRTPLSYQDLALFDSRAFTLPKEEVTNYFIWRQQDASRNSVQMLGHYHFPQSKMHGKSNSQVQDMLMLDKGVNWNDIPTWMKRGSCAVRTQPGLVCDMEIPIFTQDRFYVEQHVHSPVVRGELATAK